MRVQDPQSSVPDWAAPLYDLPVRLHPETTAWNGHIPFLFLLFSLARPRTYVELGVHRGTSFLAACEAAKRFDTSTQCYGIDSWAGDAHAGRYDGDPIYEELRRFVAARLSARPSMRQSTNLTISRSIFSTSMACTPTLR
jgi:hypothetical protein